LKSCQSPALSLKQIAIITTAITAVNEMQGAVKTSNTQSENPILYYRLKAAWLDRRREIIFICPKNWGNNWRIG